MQTRPSSHRVAPAEVAAVHVVAPATPNVDADLNADVTNAPIQVALGPAEVGRPEEVPAETQEVIQLDANAYMELTIGIHTKKKYEQILTRFGLLLHDEGRAGMGRHSKADISANAVDLLHLDEIVWDDCNSFTRVFFYKKDGTMQCSKWCANFGYAIKWLYKQKEKISIYDTLLKAKFASSALGVAKTVAQKRQKGEIPIVTGKSHLTWNGYYRFCEFVASYNEDKKANSHAMFWSFATMSWNLMARSINTAGLAFEHLSMKDDALVVNFAVTKTDQTGEKNGADKHLYGNHKNPVVCPVLSLAILFFFVGATDEHLVYGKGAAAKFSDLLTGLIKTDPSFAAQLGAHERKDIGTHSFRKGSSTYAASHTSGPSMASIYLRAGWNLGVQGSYLFQGSGSDHMLGRYLCGLSDNSMDFTALPLHFRHGTEYMSDLNKVTAMDKWPLGFQGVIPFLAAAVSFHESFLLDFLGSTHPIFQSPIFLSGFSRKFNEHVVLAHRECACGCGLRAGGIPPHVVGMSMAVDTQAELAKLKALVEQGQAASSAAASAMPEAVTEQILHNLSVAGHAVTSRDLDLLRDSILSGLEARIQSAEAAPPQSSLAAVPVPSSVGEGTVRPFTWPDGTMHFVPHLFTVRATSTLHAWLVWCLGDAQNGICQYRAITTSDLPVAARSDFSRLKAVCRYIEHLATLGEGEEDVSRPVFNPTHIENTAQATDLYSSIRTSLCTVLSIAHDQLPNTKINTVYNKLISVRPEGFFLQSRKRRRIEDGR
jgi:hypothetical protein